MRHESDDEPLPTDPSTPDLRSAIAFIVASWLVIAALAGVLYLATQGGL